MGRSFIWTSQVINDIHVKAEICHCRMRSFSILKKIPQFDDLTFLPATLTRFVIEGYREKRETEMPLGARFAKNPLVLDIPIYNTGRNYGACSGDGGPSRRSANDDDSFVGHVETRHGSSF